MLPTRNRLRETLEAGDVAVGAMAKIPTPTLIEVYGGLGLDYAFLDFELGGRSPWDSVHLEGLVRAASLAGIEPMVRLPKNDPALIRKVLDTGVHTLLIPLVESPDDVRQAVEAARFYYEGGPGGRGIAGSRANRWGAGREGFLEREDGTVLVGIILETTEALEAVDEVVSVPGLGFVNIGHNDLAHALGHGLDKADPAVRGAADRVRDACLSAGVPVGNPPGDLTDAEAVEEGYQLLDVGNEIGAVREVLGGRLDRIRA